MSSLSIKALAYLSKRKMERLLVKFHVTLPKQGLELRLVLGRAPEDVPGCNLSPAVPGPCSRVQSRQGHRAPPLGVRRVPHPQAPTAPCLHL